MNRMDKYADETPELKRRVDKYSGLYESNSSNDYDKFDVDSNVSVLKDNARSIDVDQIREMLDKKYRDNIPKRKSISVESTNVDAGVAYKKSEEKDYDLNAILDKAKQNRKVSYEEDRFNRIETSSSEKLIDEINRKYKPKEESEEAAELLNLINTITELELKNKNKDSNHRHYLYKGIFQNRNFEVFYTFIKPRNIKCNRNKINRLCPHIICLSSIKYHKYFKSYK